MKKVSLRELVADKIVFAVLIAVYYWMWARNDWRESYKTIQLSSLLSRVTISVIIPYGSKNTSRKPWMKWPKRM